MDLLDLIGDSRTDSLPAGFLRSVKMKYKQESSRVFPPGSPYINKAYNKDQQHPLDDCKRVDSAASIQSTPSFMSWKIPSRLIHGANNQDACKTPDVERGKLSSRLSNASRISAAQKLPMSRGKLEIGSETLPRLTSSHSVRSAASFGKPLPGSLPAVQNQPREKLSGKLSGKDLKNIEMAMNPKAHGNASEAISEWLRTATDKDKAIALKFFSSLSDTKPGDPGKDFKKPHSHTEGECEVCDAERTQQALQALARDGSMLPRVKLQNSPQRRPDLSRQSHYQLPKRMPTRVRQQHQTWHHLPIYTVPRDAAINKSSMFTQPHRHYGRHFSIHPEWGLHKPVVLQTSCATQ